MSKIYSEMKTFISLDKDDLGKLNAATRAYFQTRTRNRMYNLVLSKFKAAEISKAELARRIGKGADRTNRLLGSPGNWTLDTVSDLLLAICGEELNATSSDPRAMPPRNRRADDHLRKEPPVKVRMVEPPPGTNSGMATAELLRVS